MIPSGCAEWVGSEGHGTAARHLREISGIDNLIDNQIATPPAVDSAAREHRACVPIAPRFSALALDADLTLHGEEREVSTTKRQRIDNCL